MNSTLKSLVFWMVLVVVAVAVWNFSTRFQTQSKPGAVQRFHDGRGGRARSKRSPLRARKLTGSYRADKETFHTYAPAQYEGLANKLDREGHSDHREGADAEPLGVSCCIPGRPSSC